MQEFVSEKLPKLDGRLRMVAEKQLAKKITEVWEEYEAETRGRVREAFKSQGVNISEEQVGKYMELDTTKVPEETKAYIKKAWLC